MQDIDLIEPKMPREEVYKAVDTERDYQAQVISMDKSICGTIPKSVGDYLTMLTAYINRTNETWVSTPGSAASLHMVRKIAAVAVKCMEQHGAPFRNLNETPSHKQL